MAILVDYACPACRGRSEQWADNPVPSHAACPACGAQARRAWSPVGLASSSQTGKSGPEPVTGTSGIAPNEIRRPLCVRNPDVPGLCHLSPAAARTWVARARKDNRALEREIARQEAAAAVRPPTLGDLVSHTHGS
jgi:putative FmdB family regulatory protein